MESKEKKIWDISNFYPLFFTIVFIVILFQYPFSSLEAIFYDLRTKLDIGIQEDDEVIIISLDETSDQFIGDQYPYTYATHVRMLEKLIDSKPKIINYLIGFLEPKSGIDEQNLKHFKSLIGTFKRDGGYFRFGVITDTFGIKNPPKSLNDVGHSLAILNVDEANFSKDGVSRRAILNVSGENSLHLWTANKYRNLNGLKEMTPTEYKGSYYQPEADATFSLFRYSASPRSEYSKLKVIPFHRVIGGNFPKDFFKNKIVLIGPSYVGNPSDFILTPFNRERFETPKLNVHARIIQALIKGKTVYRVPIEVTYAIAILITIILSFSITKTKPTYGLALTFFLMVSVLFISYLLYISLGLWLYTIHIILTIFVVYYIWIPFRAIGEYQTRFAIEEETKLLRKVENLKQNFISLMSHDLKTPVAKIAGLADIMIQHNKGNENNIKNLKTIVESTKELNKFITSILDLTKIESRNITLNQVSKDINTIMETIVDELRFEAQQKNVHLNLELAPLYPIKIDPILIKRVFHNLVENALKYSGDGKNVVIKTWDDEKFVYIVVSDNGVGIAPEDLDHVFDKFYRVKNDASHKIKGTGLGLYLVRYFVELHGGHIKVESERNKGTTFTVQLKNE
jgi:signal transduction histidine kinase